MLSSIVYGSKTVKKIPRHMKAVVNLDIRNSLPNSIDKLQLAASEINKLSFDAPITINICFTVEGFHVYGDIPDFLKDRLNDILDAL